MKLQLYEIDPKKAMEIIHWCVVNDIDADKSKELADLLLATAICNTPIPEDIEWEIEIPEEHISWMILKFDLEIIEMSPYFERP